jgi:hypothetical protein
MKRTLLVLSLSSLPFLVALAPAAPPQCPNLIVHEPLVLYDFSGSGFAGPIDIGLTVYNDGTARISQASQSFGNKAQVQFVGADNARQLANDISLLGAGLLCDVPSLVVDLPPTTVTILRGDTDSRAHTFTWYDANGPYAAINQRIQTFIQTTFPNF